MFFSPTKPTRLIRLPLDGEVQGARCTDLRADPLFPPPLKIGESEYLECSQWEAFLCEVMVRGSQARRGFLDGLAAVERPPTAERPAAAPSVARRRAKTHAAEPVAV